MIKWIDEAKTGHKIREVGAQLGLTAARGGFRPCPACGAEKRSGKDRRQPITATADRWRCWSCDAAGSVVDLVAWSVTGAPFDPKNCTAVRGWFGEPAPANIPPRKPEPPPAPPPVDQISALWAACHAPESDPGAVAWFTSRGFTVDQVGRMGRLVRVLPRGVDCPPWARFGRLSWAESEYRLIFPTYSPAGLAGVRARWIGKDPPPGPKSVAAAGIPSRGTVLGCEAWRRGSAAVVSICEGEPDWLRLVVEGAGASVGLIGTWTPELAAQIPAGAEVRILTDDDDAGRKYAAKIRTSTSERCLEPVKTETPRPDLTDLAVQGGRVADLALVVTSATPLSLPGVLAALEAADKTAVAPILAGLLDRIEDLGALYRSESHTWTGFTLRAGALPSVTKGQIKDLEKEVKRAAKRQADAAPRPAFPDGASLDDLTVDLDGVAGLMSPPGYRVDFSGVWAGDERLMGEPVIIAGCQDDRETGVIRFDMAWRRDGRWQTGTIDRGAALDARKLLKLADFGFPVNSGTGADVTRYLEAFELANLPLMTTVKSTARMGWLGSGVFQIGSDCIGGDSALVADGGLADLAGGWTTAGTWEAWRDAMDKDLGGRHLVQLALYAAAVAPLLTILDLDGFVVDWSGATSRGKTTALRIGASMWGDPGRIVGSWGTASVVGPQECAAFLHSLPLILDDTKQTDGRPEIVARMLYDIPAGRERQRGQAGGGLRRVKTWRTVLLSTGEKAVVDFSGDAGARARSLCIRGAPFGGDTSENQKAAERMVEATRANYGQLGRMLIERLISDPGVLVERHADLRAYFSKEAGGSVSRRLSSAVAALHLAGDLLHELGLPNEGELDDVVGVAWDAALKSGEDSDRPAAAMIAVINWATANGDRFEGVRKRTDGPVHGWAGRWEQTISGGWDWLGIFPAEVRVVLDRLGFDRDYCLNEWSRRGWLQRTPGRTTKGIRLATGTAWLYVIDGAAVAPILSEA